VTTVFNVEYEISHRRLLQLEHEVLSTA